MSNKLTPLRWRKIIEGYISGMASDTPYTLVKMQYMGQEPIDVPPGLSREELRQFILKQAAAAAVPT